MTKIAIIRPYRHLHIKGLLRASRPLSITIFETEADVGKGTPYRPDINDRAMLANIASIELPPIVESLTGCAGRCQEDCHAARRLRVLAAFLAECERSEAGRLADAAPPNRPPLRED